MFSDLRFALRMVAKNPALAAVAILSLALGIGANTTIFSYAQALLLGTPPVMQAQRLAEVWTYTPDPGMPFHGYLPLSYPDYQDLARQTHAFSGMTCYSPFSEANWKRGDQIRTLNGQLVAANYFAVLGVQPVLGRGFTTEEGQAAGARPVVVISYALWQEAFGRAQEALGRTMRLNGRDYTLVGVAPRGFNGLFAGIQPAFYAPAAQAEWLGLPGTLTARGNRSWMAVGRLAAGQSLRTASADLQLAASHLDAQYPNDEGKDFGGRATALGLVPYAFRQPVQGLTLLLALIVGLVLLIACANTANLLLVQAQGRRRELAIRGALGASRGRLARQALTESIVLALLAGGAGLLMADWLAPLILQLAPPDAPVGLNLGMNGAVVGFTFGLALLTGAITGLVPALRGARGDVVQDLRDGSAGAGYARSRLRSGLVAGEIAVCVIVLAGAGLCLRSLQQARAIQPGFEPAHLLLAQSVDPQSLGYHGKRASAFMKQMLERARHLPGVTDAAWIAAMPLQPSESDMEVAVPGLQPPPGHKGFDTQYQSVGPDYFRAMGTRLIAGRGYNDQDLARAGQIVVVNEAFAQRFWPHANALGEQIRFIEGDKLQPATVIGVAETGKYRTLGEPARPYLFRLTDFDRPATMVLRVAGDPRGLLAPLRRTLTELDPNLPSDQVEDGAQYMAVPLLAAHLTAVLLGGFAVLALLLAVVGLYGVVAYSVSQRTHEFGIRMALGASAGDVAGLVLRQGLRLALIGVAVGMAIALVLLRLLSVLLYGVSASDPVTFAAVALLLAAVAALASYLPARRATHVDPLLALRYE